MSHQTMNQEEQQQQDQRIQQALSRIRRKILVMSGKGGVGKSTVAVNLAAALAKAGRKVGVLDVDLHGPTVPVLLGIVGQRAGASEDALLPLPVSPNLTALSIGNLLDENDRAVIWRGPMKISAIRQLIADVDWGELDYLIIDSPPGTGDEPLTVAQTIPDLRALIVTTPQEVSLADVRKSIDFCKAVMLPILGLVENLSGYVCSHCGHFEPLFGEGGGQRTAEKFELRLLGRVPIDPAVVRGGDAGRPYVLEEAEGPASQAFAEIVKAVEEKLG